MSASTEIVFILITIIVIICNDWLCIGKNAYALAVLQRVEMKLDGGDIAENRYLLFCGKFVTKSRMNYLLTVNLLHASYREISIAEQVDYLLKQASSVDNLCNMYEGWTPWI